MSEQTNDRNRLVIYYDDVQPQDGPKIQIDEFTLTSQVTPGLGPVQVLDIAQKVGTMAVKAKEALNEPAPEPMPGVVKIEITAVLGFNFAKVGEVTSYVKEIKDDYNPFKQTLVETMKSDSKVAVVETTKTDYPFFEPTEEQTVHIEDIKKDPVTVEKTPEVPEVPVEKKPEVTDPKTIAPPDETWVADEFTDKLNEIMKDFAVKEFSEGEDAEAYLDYQLEKAGIELKITSTEMKLANAGPKDPAGVESLLRKQGIKDSTLIEKVRAETNDVIKRFEDTIGTMQAAISGIDPNNPEEFSTLIEQWDVDLSSRFSTDLPEALKATQPLKWDMIGGVVTIANASASSPQANASTEPAKISPSGLIIRAGLGTSASKSFTADVEPGFYATPMISVFDEDAWKMEA